MIYSRSYLNQRIKEEKFRTCRTGSPFTLVLFNPFNLISTNSKPKKKVVEEIRKIVGLDTRQTDIQGWWDRKIYAIFLLDTSPEGGDAVIGKLVSELRAKGYELPESAEKTFFKIYTFPDLNQTKRYTKDNRSQDAPKGSGKNKPNQNMHIVNSIENQCEMRCFTLNSVKRHYEIIKRGFDILLSAILLVILLPLYLLIALIIKLDSPGPVIYKQARVGKGGNCFNFFKFRTMYHNCDEKIHENHVKNLANKVVGLSSNGLFNESSYKLIEDDRVTRVGKYLRKTSLDELPQLFNVLKGDMSLVGPRPHPVYEVALYNRWFRYRLDIKPGITGLGQVDGRYNKNYKEVYRLDLRYIKKASFLLDLKILFRTILVVLSSRGAY